MRKFLILAGCIGVFVLGTGSAFALSSDKPPAPPGQGECDHGNGDNQGNAGPCKEDPQPEHGKDCDEHGPKEGGVNEDHCKGETTPPPTTTETTETVPTVPTVPTTPPTVPTVPATPPVENPPVTQPPVVVPPVETTTAEETTSEAPAVAPPVKVSKPAAKANAPVAKKPLAQRPSKAPQKAPFTL